MIAMSKFEEAQRLLALGTLSQRKIAAKVGISRATVGAIASGKFQDREARQRARAEAEELIPAGPLVRCAGCGGRVLMPCLLCRVRGLNEKEQNDRRAARRRQRERDLRQLLHAARHAQWQRDARDRHARPNYLPAADVPGPSDCR
jgi:hypothetical protein